MERLNKLWKNLRLGRALRSDLRAIATVEPSADLWDRIQREVQPLPVSETLPFHLSRSRRFAPLLATGLLLLVVGVGTVAAQQGWFTWRRPYERQIGPFVISGYFYGWMEYYDASGRLQAVVDTHQDEVRGGTYQVRPMLPGILSGTSNRTGFTYVLKDDSGRPAATLVLRRQYEDNGNNPYMKIVTKTLPEARRFLDVAWQWQINRWRTGSVSSEETPLGVTGYHGGTGLIWSLRGTAKVTVETDDKTLRPQQLETSTGFGPPLSDAIAEYERDHPEPEFNALYKDNVYRVFGFGRHELRDKSGAVVLTVTIERLDAPE